MAQRSNRAPAGAVRWLGGLAPRFALGLALAFFGAACGGGGDDPPATVIDGPSPSPGASVDTPTPRPPQVFEPSEQLADARRLVREGRYDEAAAAFTAAADATSDGALASEALLGAAVAFHELGDLSAAVEALRLAADRAPPGSLLQRRVAYLLAVRLDEAGDPLEAAGVLGPYVAAPLDDLLQWYIEAEYARASAAAGDTSTAEAVWEDLLAQQSLPSTLRADILGERAIVAEEVGDPAAAAAWLVRYIALVDEPEARLRAATLALEAGDSDTFAEQLQAIIVNHPASRYAVQAIGELRGRGLAVDPGREGYVYYRQRAFREARITLEPAIDDETLPPRELAFRLYYLAAAYDDAGFKAESVPYYDRAVAVDPGGPYDHRGRYWAARALEEAGEAPAASARYRDLYLDGPPGDFTAEAAFRAGYVWLEAGDARAAIDTWAALAAGDGDPRLAYWRARAFEQVGDGEAARVAYLAAAAQPRSFHGAEAARVLAGDGDVDAGYVPLEAPHGHDWDAIAAWVEGIVPGVLPGEGGTAALDLAQVGLGAAAGRLLMAEASETADPWRLLGLARDACEAGLPDIGIRIGRRLQSVLGVSERDLPDAFLRVLYPLDVPVLLDEAGRANGIDPLLLAALIQQESLWQADAVSIAGAIGLTQVMPATGEGIAHELGHADFKAADLVRPAVAVEFGAYYLGSQIRRFGDVHHALAAYNGGPGNAAAWAAAAPGPPPDFVEAVTFAETRRYVELVMGHYHMYRALYR